MRKSKSILRKLRLWSTAKITTRNWPIWWFKSIDSRIKIGDSRKPLPPELAQVQDRTQCSWKGFKHTRKKCSITKAKATSQNKCKPTTIFLTNTTNYLKSSCNTRIINRKEAKITKSAKTVNKLSIWLWSRKNYMKIFHQVLMSLICLKSILKFWTTLIRPMSIPYIWTKMVNKRKYQKYHKPTRNCLSW